MRVISTINTQNSATASQYRAAMRSVSQSASRTYQHGHGEAVQATDEVNQREGADPENDKGCQRHECAWNLTDKSPHNVERVADKMAYSTINSLAGVR